MKKRLLLPLLLIALLSAPCLAQSGKPPVYMQVFFEGPNWMAGREVLHYAPAFKGKTGEVVAEGEDTRQLTPGYFLQSLFHNSTNSNQSNGTATVTTEKGTFVTDGNGKTRRQTDEDIRKANQAEQDNLDRGLQLLEKRGRLAREVLTKSLNETAAEGWEVVQMTSYGNGGGLVYLLRKN